MSRRSSGWWPESGEESEEERNEIDGDPGSGSPQPPPRRPRGLASRDRPKAASRYSLYVGLAFILIAAIAVINAIRTDEGGILGTDRETDRGLSLPEFAAPAIASGLEGDANIAQDDCESSRNPCPEDQVQIPACELDLKGAIRVCDLFDRPLAISFWFTRGGDCTPTQDAFDRVAGDRRDVNFLSVNVLDDREEVAALVRERGWEVPVAHDSDGAVSNIYGVGVCPTILFAYPGGILHAAEVKPGNFSAEEIEARLDDLVEASAEREPSPAGTAAR